VRNTREISSQKTNKAIKDRKYRKEEEGRDVVLPSSLNQLKK
jgi:hypothetical protein